MNLGIAGHSIYYLYKGMAVTAGQRYAGNKGPYLLTVGRHVFKIPPFEVVLSLM